MITVAEKHRIETLLERLGCSARETEIYLQCLTMDPSSIVEIARRTGMNRLTVHSAVEQLIQKGLLFETRRGKRRLIAAESPDVLFRLITRKKEELEKIEGNVEYAVKLLTSLIPESQGKPSVRFYEGVEGYKKMLEETLKAKNDVLIFSFVPLLAGLVGPDNLENFFRKRAKKHIASRMIFPPCPFADRLEKKQSEYGVEIRYLPPGTEWQSGIFCWNENVALLSYTQNRLHCTIIENKDIADFYRKIIFEMCWKQATPSG